jgi:hypothetical protein
VFCQATYGMRVVIQTMFEKFVSGCFSSTSHVLVLADFSCINLLNRITQVPCLKPHSASVFARGWHDDCCRIKGRNYGTRPSDHSSANFKQRRCHPVSRAHARARTSEYFRFVTLEAKFFRRAMANSNELRSLRLPGRLAADRPSGKSFEPFRFCL